MEGGSNGVSAEDEKYEFARKVWIVNKLPKFTEAKKEGLKLFKITQLQ